MHRQNFNAVAGAVSALISSGNTDGIKAFFPIFDDYDPMPVSDYGDGTGISVVKLHDMLLPEGTDTLIAKVKELEADKKTVGIIFDINGPGGSATFVPQAAAAIRACSKPTATVVRGMMASGHFWIGTAADRTFVESPACYVGSVGAFCTFADWKGYLKSQGINIYEIYPESADLKNKPFRDLMESGDDTAIKDALARLHRMFAEEVAAQIGVAYDAELPIFRGQDFAGDEAVAAGYIDQQGGIDEAARWIVATAAAEEARKMYK